jgi:tetratricopeptide (TPR) repeat protein
LKEKGNKRGSKRGKQQINGNTRFKMAFQDTFFPSRHRHPPPATLPISSKSDYLPAHGTLRVWCERAPRVLLTLGLLACAASAARRGVAEWLFNRQTIAGARLAILWNPQSARYRAALADKLQNSIVESDLAEAVRLSEEATRLEPQVAQYWVRLAAAYEAEGRTSDAVRAYRMAVQLFPLSPDINWQLGNFLLRQDDSVHALGAFRKVIAGSPAMRRATYQTAWGATEDSAQILEIMIPAQRDILADYLRYLLDAGRLDAARPVWWKLMSTGTPPPGQALRYLDAVLARQRTEEAIAAWDALSARAPQLYAPYPHSLQESAGNRVTNAGFEHEVLNGGLDWHILSVDGVDAHVIAGVAFEGARCLELVFAGTANLAYFHVFEFVPVEPGTTYLFTARVRAHEISSDQRPRFLLRDSQDERLLRVETAAVPATSDWTELRVEFRTGPATRVVDVRLFRPQSRKFDGRIGGTLWIDDVRLVATASGEGR